MSWFLFFRSPLSDVNGQILARAEAGLNRLEQKWLRSNRSMSVMRFDSGFVIHPKEHLDQPSSDVDIAFSDSRLVCLYGDIEGLTAEDLLDEKAYPSIDSLLGVRDGEGCFGLLAVDKVSTRSVVFGDGIGQRCLRYCQTSQGVAVSSHDLPLLSTGELLPDVDRVSLQSIGVVGWSLDDRSLLAGIGTCRPDEQLVIEHERVAHLELGMSKPAPCDAEKSLPLIVTQFLDKKVPAGEPVVVELSAGFDSRAALAATLEVVSSSRIVGFAEGPKDSDDVQIAAEVAKRAGIQFSHRTTGTQTAAEFSYSACTSAFETNGNIDCTVLASSKPRDEKSSAITVCGDGGEIYRGYYYPFQPGARLLRQSNNAPAALLRAELGLASVTSPLDERLQQVVARLGRNTHSPQDVLDLFYVRERFGVWNQKLMRHGHGTHRFGPFYSRAGAAALFATSSPVAQTHNRLHAELIRRALPSCVDIPVNRGATPRQVGGGSALMLLGDANELKVKLLRRVGSKLNRRKPLEEARLHCLQGIMEEVMEDVSPAALAEITALVGGSDASEALPLPLETLLRHLSATLFLDMAQDVYATSIREINYCPEFTAQIAAKGSKGDLASYGA